MPSIPSGTACRSPSPTAWESLKPDTESVTFVNGGGGADGFQTQGHLWSPAHPDIQEGDWVYARADDGRTAQVHIGQITGQLDLLADSVSGTVTAPFTQTLRLNCSIWSGVDADQINLTVDPAGGSYACSWAGIYDIGPNIDVAVSYYEPGYHQIINIFNIGAPYLSISKWGEQQIGEGGNYVYHINYYNYGSGTAEGVVITDTLPVGLSYLSHNAPFPLISTDPPVWDLGTLAQGSGSFDLFVHVDAPAGTVLTNTVKIDTGTPWDQSPPENKQYSWSTTVQPNNTQLNIGMWAHTGNPAPGYQFIYEVSPCNWGFTASAGVTLTTTLPVSTTLMEWWGASPGWSEVSRTDSQLVLSRPTIPGNQCQNVQFLVELDANTQVGATLLSSARVFSSDDADLSNNETSLQLNAGSPSTNLSISKTWANGSVVPGGRLTYSLNFWVNGNVRPQALLITDTLPVSTTLAQINAVGLDVTQYNSGPGYVVWQVNGAGNSWNSGFQVALDVDPSAAPGAVLTNSAEVGALGPYPEENNTIDNSSQVVVTLNPPGPNLKVSQTHNLDLMFMGDFRYIITFENPGSETIYNVEILDTLPGSTTYDGGYNFNFDWGRLQGVDNLGSAVRWRLSYLAPGETGSIVLWLRMTNLRPAYFTNTVEITTPPGDIDPSDNISTDLFVLGEVTNVSLQVGEEHSNISGAALPNSSVYIQTATGMYSTQTDMWGGGWGIGDIGSVQPGDTITVTAGAGILPVIITVPDPYSVSLDTTLEQVWGQIGGTDGQLIAINGNWPDSHRLLTAGSEGAYSVTYTDIPQGATVQVEYATSFNYASVNFWRKVDDPFVNLAVGKSAQGSPAPGGNYTYQINYRNESSDLASGVLLTDTLPAGMTYVSDTSGRPVSVNGSQVVWDLGDFNYTYTGFQLVVAVDPSVTPGQELLNTLQIGSPTPEWNYGDNFYQWSTTAVANDTHLYAYMGATPDDPAPDSNYVYWLNVCNWGSTASSSVLLTTTLPVTVTYTGWSGSGWSEVSQAGSQIVLSHPSILGYGSCAPLSFNMQATAPEGTPLQASVVFTASNDMETTDNTASHLHWVGAPRVDYWVNKYLSNGMLLPGSQLIFGINYGYGANFVPGSLTITETLPVSTTFMDAWRWGPSGQEFLTPVAVNGNEVVFDFNDLNASDYSSTLYLRLLVDPNAIPGAELVNTADIRSHPLEGFLDNNHSTWSGVLQASHSDLSISSGGGWDLQNNRANLWLQVSNSGNLNSGPAVITVTYPVSMSLIEPISYDYRWGGWQNYPDQHYFTATLNNLEAQNSTWISFSTEMQGGGPIAGGQTYIYQGEVSLVPNDFVPENNHTGTSLASGPDLFVEKAYTSGNPPVPGGNVTYSLRVGNRSASNPWSPQGRTLITDTLPAGLSYSGSNWTPTRIDGQTIVWDVGMYYPGWDTSFEVYATITNTATGGDSFTNTAQIGSTSPLDVDLNPADNTSSVSFTLLDVRNVDLWVGTEHSNISGGAIPASTVVVQAPSGPYSSIADPWGGYWSIGDIGSIQPGDTLTVTAGSGGLPVVIHVPDPFSINIDSIAGVVWGQIAGAEGHTVNINGYWPDGYRSVTAGPDGVFSSGGYPYIPQGSNGVVNYNTTIDQAAVTFNRAFDEAYVNLAVTKSGSYNPAPGGNYQYQINVSNQSFDLASSVRLTDTLPTGMTYLSDNSGFPVSVNGSQVVWEVGDVAYFSHGFQMWVSVDPSVVPGQEMVNTIQVSTPTPEWEYADNSYQWSATAVANDTHMYVDIGTSLYDPAPGSEYYYWVSVCNSGFTNSSGIVLTTTLPVSTTFTGWTSGSGWSQVSQTGDQVVLSHPGLLGYGNCANAEFSVQLDPSAPVGGLLTAAAEFTASNDMETTDNADSIQHTVSAPSIDLWINKYYQGGALVPGSILSFDLQYGYGANFGPGTLTITDTLPAGVTFIDAWHNGPFGQEFVTPIVSEPGYVVFELNGLTNYQYSRDLYMRLQVDAGAIPGTELVNTAQIRTHPAEGYLDNNQSSWSSVLQPNHADLTINLNSGWDLPNNLANLSGYLYNSGDLSSGPGVITFTYPVSMSLVGSPSYDWRMSGWQDYPADHYFTLSLNDLEPGGYSWFYYTVQMQGGAQIPLGQVFTFEANAFVPSTDFNPANNHSTSMLASGQDFFVEKSLVYGDLRPGGSLSYQLHVGNRTTSQGYWPQGSMVISDTLPAGITFTGANYTPTSQNGQTLTWNFGNAGPGYDAWIQIWAAIDPSASAGDIFTNTAAIGSTSPADFDINPLDNLSSHTFTILQPAFEISKQVEGNLVAGTLVTYTLSVTNTGNLTATNIHLYDPVPPELAYASGGGGWDGYAVNWNMNQLTPQQNATAWFAAYLPCSSGVTVTNQNYLVTSSDQGVNSPVGAPLSFVTVAPALTAAYNFEPPAPVAGGAVTFTDHSTTDGRLIAAREWDFGDGSPLESGLTPGHIYTAPGDYIVSLTVTDECGFSDQITNTISVTAPHLVASFDQSAGSIVVGETVYFTDTSTTDGLPITGWSWDLGEGAPVTGPPNGRSHLYRPRRLHHHPA